MYEIRDDIPIPDTNVRVSKYNFDLLKIGSSFAVPYKERGRLSSSAGQYKRRRPETFNYTIRVVIEDGEKVARIWRVEVKGKELAQAKTIQTLPEPSPISKSAYATLRV